VFLFHLSFKELLQKNLSSVNSLSLSHNAGGLQQQEPQDEHMQNTSVYFAPKMPPLNVHTDSYQIRTADTDSRGRAMTAVNINAYSNADIIPGVVLERFEENKINCEDVQADKVLHDEKCIDLSTSSNVKFSGDKYEGHLHVERSGGSKALLEHWEATAIKMGMNDIHDHLNSGASGTNNEAHNLLWSSVQRPLSASVQGQGTAANAVIAKRRHAKHSGEETQTSGSGFRMTMRRAVDELIDEKICQRDVSIPSGR
jgi:hypothetical protein